jgi:hypothetical protein
MEGRSRVARLSGGAPRARKSWSSTSAAQPPMSHSLSSSSCVASTTAAAPGGGGSARTRARLRKRKKERGHGQLEHQRRHRVRHPLPDENFANMPPSTAARVIVIRHCAHPIVPSLRYIPCRRRRVCKILELRR